MTFDKVIEGFKEGKIYMRETSDEADAPVYGIAENFCHIFTMGEILADDWIEITGEGKLWSGKK